MNQENNEESNKHFMSISKFINWVGGLVVFLSIGFVFTMIWLLYNQVRVIEDSASVTSIVESILPIISDSNPTFDELEYVGKLIMESDAQFLRTERAQSLVGARLTVMVVAELIGLCLIVLGGAFIFVRIRGVGSISGEKSTEDGKKQLFQFISDFPGLFLCAFGMLLVIWALNTAIHDNSQTVTTDRPLYFPANNYIEVTNTPSTLEGQKNLRQGCLQYAYDPAICPAE